MTNEKRLQALAELQEDGERMGFDLDKWIAKELEATPYKQADKEPIATIRAEIEHALEAGFSKALDLVMEELKQLKNTSRRLSAIKENTTRVMGYGDCMSEIQDIISKLRSK